MKFPFLWVCMLAPSLTLAQTEARPRIRDLGVQIGILQPGPLNAITNVAGVKVGQITLIRGDNIRTGVTAILLHGFTQVNELGEIETPILLTSTLSVGRAADALIGYVLKLPGNEAVNWERAHGEGIAAGRDHRPAEETWRDAHEIAPASRRKSR